MSMASICNANEWANLNRMCVYFAQLCFVFARSVSLCVGENAPSPRFVREAINPRRGYI